MSNASPLNIVVLPACHSIIDRNKIAYVSGYLQNPMCILVIYGTSHPRHAMTQYRVAQKVRHYQIIKKSQYIVLKSANEIRLLRQIKLSIKH